MQGWNYRLVIDITIDFHPCRYVTKLYSHFLIKLRIVRIVRRVCGHFALCCSYRRAVNTAFVRYILFCENQGCHILEKSWIFLLSWKSWKVLENIWVIFRASPGQNSKATFFNNKHKKIRYIKEWILSPVEIAFKHSGVAGGKWEHAPWGAGFGDISAHFLQSFKRFIQKFRPKDA